MKPNGSIIFVTCRIGKQIFELLHVARDCQVRREQLRLQSNDLSERKVYFRDVCESYFTNLAKLNASSISCPRFLALIT